MTAIVTPLTQPFASERSDNIAPSTVPSDTVANQPNGFPIDQMLDPSSPEWQAVKEQEMNGVFNYYTNILFQLGQGKLFTFNQELSDAIVPNVKETVGYPAGIILWCASNNTFQRSLIDGNTANFVTTPSYINDGINWVTEGAYPDIQDNTNTGAVTIGGRIAGSTQQMICNSAVTSNLVSKVIVKDGVTEISLNTLTDLTGIGMNNGAGFLTRPYLLGNYIHQATDIENTIVAFKDLQRLFIDNFHIINGVDGTYIQCDTTSRNWAELTVNIAGYVLLPLVPPSSFATKIRLDTIGVYAVNDWYYASPQRFCGTITPTNPTAVEFGARVYITHEDPYYYLNLELISPIGATGGPLPATFTAKILSDDVRQI